MHSGRCPKSARGKNVPARMCTRHNIRSSVGRWWEVPGFGPCTDARMATAALLDTGFTELSYRGRDIPFQNASQLSILSALWASLAWSEMQRQQGDRFDGHRCLRQV